MSLDRRRAKDLLATKGIRMTWGSKPYSATSAGRLDQIGPMYRSMADCAIVFSATLTNLTGHRGYSLEFSVAS